MGRIDGARIGLPPAEAVPFPRPDSDPPMALPRAAPRRILIVSDAWAPQVNGVVRSYENIRRVLEGQGCTVEVIGPDTFRSVALPGYREIPLALAPKRRLAAMIEAFDPEAVHLGVEGPLGWAARAHCRAQGRPFSTFFHTNFPAYAAVRSPAALRGTVERAAVALARRFHAPAAFTHVATPTIEAQLRRWGFAGRLAPLAHGVDCGLFHPGPERPPGDPPVLLYVGRVAPEKNLSAFLGLTEAQIGPARKVVVGDGPALPALRRRHPEASFHGLLTGVALAEAYRAADVFVFPSRTDTFGLVLLEAMASGLPVAALDAPGPRDIIAGDARLGAVEGDLATAVRGALAAPGSRAERHRIARARYDWARVGDGFLAGCAELAR